MPLFAISAVMYGVLIYFAVFQLRSSPASRALRNLLIVALVWTLATIAELSAPDAAGKFLAARFQFSAITLLPVTIFLFGTSYTHRDLTALRKLLLLLIPAATNMLVWFFRPPGIFWDVPILEAGRQTLSLTFGPWFFFVHTPYSYLLILITIVMLVVSIIYMHRLYRMQALVLIIAFLLPLSLNVYYVLILPRTPQYNFTTAVFSISGFLLAFSLYRYDFMNLIPAARHLVLDYIQEGVIVLDSSLRIIDINPSARSLFDRKETLTGCFLSDISPGSLRDVIRTLAESRDDCPDSIIHEENRKVLDLRVYPMKSPTGGKFGKIITMHDVSEQHELFKEVQRLASLDSLTGLYNRRKLLELTEDALAKSGETSLILFDVDVFKDINDTYGHEAGDRVLNALAACFRNFTKEHHFIGRHGGDEFALVLPGMFMQDAVSLAETIRIAAENLVIEIPSGNLKTTVSIGVSSSSLLKDPSDINELFAAADRAMYEAKLSGRNRTAAAKQQSF